MRKLCLLVVLSAATMYLAGCGFKNEFVAPTATTTTSPQQPGSTITGVATKGPLSGATVEVWQVNPSTGDDAGTAPLISVTNATKSDGSFSITLPAPVPAGTPLRVKVKGGTYIDDSDVTKTPINNTIELDTLIDDGSQNVSGLAVTVITDQINSTVIGTLKGLTNPVKVSGAPLPGSNFPGTHGNVTNFVAGHWGFTGNPEKTTPCTSGSQVGNDCYKIGLISAAMMQCAHNALVANPSVDPGTFIKAVSADFADGLLDGFGLVQGKRTQIFLDPPKDTLPLSSSAATTDLLNCLNQVASNPNSSVNKDPNPASQGQINTVVGALDQSIINSPAAPSTGFTAGGSGSTASMTINGKQYLFVAARGRGIVVIDFSNPTATNPLIKVWTTLAQTVFGSFPNVGGVVPVLGFSTHAQILVFSYSSPNIGVLNAEKLVSGTPGIDDTAATDFSGQATTNANSVFGALLDITRKGVWVYNVGSAFTFFDLSTNQASTKTFPQDPGQCEVENLGGDLGINYIFGAGYCGIQLMDVNANISYDLDPTFVSTNLPEVDQSAVDTKYHVAVAMNECYTQMGVFDLSKVTLTAPASPGAPGSWVPKAGGFVNMQLSPGNTLQCSEAIGIESNTHLAIMTEEHGSNPFYVVKIDNPAAPAGSTWAGFSDWAYFQADWCSPMGNPGCPNFQSPIQLAGWNSGGAHDPHSTGTALAVANQKAYGLVLSGDNQHLLVVDLAAFLAIPRAGTTGDAAHVAATNPSSLTTPAWWVLSWLQP